MRRMRRSIRCDILIPSGKDAEGNRRKGVYSIYDIEFDTRTKVEAFGDTQAISYYFNKLRHLDGTH